MTSGRRELHSVSLDVVVCCSFPLCNFSATCLSAGMTSAGCSCLFKLVVVAFELALLETSLVVVVQVSLFLVVLVPFLDLVQ